MSWLLRLREGDQGGVLAGAGCDDDELPPGVSAVGHRVRVRRKRRRAAPDLGAGHRVERVQGTPRRRRRTPGRPRSQRTGVAAQQRVLADLGLPSPTAPSTRSRWREGGSPQSAYGGLISGIGRACSRGLCGARSGGLPNMTSVAP